MNYEKDIIEIIKSLIYHGRYFSPKRDKIVEEKALNKLKEIIKR